jgi:hypothetical protein
MSLNCYLSQGTFFANETELRTIVVDGDVLKKARYRLQKFNCKVLRLYKRLMTRLKEGKMSVGSSSPARELFTRRDTGETPCKALSYVDLCVGNARKSNFLESFS